MFLFPAIGLKGKKHPPGHVKYPRRWSEINAVDLILHRGFEEKQDDLRLGGDYV